MQRSRINTLLADAEDFLAACRVALPPFAFWTPDEFERRVRDGHERLVAAGMGWLVSDFGLDDFAADGVVGFCSCSGTDQQDGRTYAERHLVLREGQRIPHRFHRRRCKDLINCGPGNLCLCLHRTNPDDGLDETANVQVQVDGLTRKLAPGARLVLRPGERALIEPVIFHQCRAEQDDLVAREVSSATDEESDTLFLPQVGLAAAIEEDEMPRRLLVSDYAGRFPELLSPRSGT